MQGGAYLLNPSTQEGRNKNIVISRLPGLHRMISSQFPHLSKNY